MSFLFANGVCNLSFNRNETRLLTDLQQSVS